MSRTGTNESLSNSNTASAISAYTSAFTIPVSQPYFYLSNIVSVFVDYGARQITKSPQIITPICLFVANELQSVANFNGLSQTSNVAKLVGNISYKVFAGVDVVAASLPIQQLIPKSLQPCLPQFNNAPFGTTMYYQNLMGGAFSSAGAIIGGAAASVIFPATFAGLAVGAVISIITAGIVTGTYNYINNFSNIQTHLNNSSPNVGGILLDKCAIVTGSLPHISGAYWDSLKGVLVLHGPSNITESSELQLTGLEFDHLIVALRAALAGEHIGVSIDPPAEYRDEIHCGQFPPNRTPMYVSYLGNTEGTLFGAIMFEADRVMKCLSQETDNVTGNSLRAKAVKDYKSLFELFNLNTSGTKGNWFRFWIEVDKVEIAHDPTGRALRFGEAKMIVKNQPEYAAGGNAEPDPASEAFAKHLTEFYDEYAKEFPIFARLKEIAKITALARFLVKEGVPFDDQTILKQPILPVSTPETTPGIIAKSPSNSGGSQLIYGGVDMNIFPTILNKDDKLAQTMKDLATSADPGGLASSWSFMGPDGLTVATSMKLRAVKNPYRALTSSDHSFSESWKDSIRSIRRYYDSSVPGGDFGPGWWLFLPFRLQVIPRSIKKSEVRIGPEKKEDDSPRIIILHNFINPASSIYRRHKAYDNQQGKAYCRVAYQSNSANKPDVIYFHAGFYTYSDNKYTFQFNNNGLLQAVRIAQGSGLIAKYGWENGFINDIDFGSGKKYAIKYDKSILNPRISEIVASDGGEVTYQYGNNGLLNTCRVGNKPKVNYRYDQRNRISETRDADGNVVTSNVYDSDGNINKTNTNEIKLADGTKLQNELKGGRITTVVDESGGKAEYKYRNNGTLSSISGIIDGNELWKAEYNENGALNQFKDIYGLIHKISYQTDGMIAKIAQNGSTITFPETNEKTKKIIGTDSKLGSWEIKLNESGLPETILDVNHKKSKFVYRNNVLKTIKTPEFSFDVLKNNGSSEFLMKYKSGIKQTLSIDRKNKESKMIIQGSDKGKREVFIKEDGYKISDCAGSAEYKFNAENLEIDMVLSF